MTEDHERWDRFYCAAMTGILANPELISMGRDKRLSLAAHYANDAMEVSLPRGVVPLENGRGHASRLTKGRSHD